MAGPRVGRHHSSGMLSTLPWSLLSPPTRFACRCSEQSRPIGERRGVISRVACEGGATPSIRASLDPAGSCGAGSPGGRSPLTCHRTRRDRGGRCSGIVSRLLSRPRTRSIHAARRDLMSPPGHHARTFSGCARDRQDAARGAARCAASVLTAPSTQPGLATT